MRYNGGCRFCFRFFVQSKKKKKRYLTFTFYIFKMKVYAYCFWKTNNKVQPNLLDGGALRMRCAHKMRQVRFLCWVWETSGHFALALQSSSLSVSSRSRAPGPWKPGLHYALVLLVPFGSCDLGEAVSTPLKSPFSLLFTLSKHLASAWAWSSPETCLHLFCSF